jgi:hypothetical protein
MADDDEYNPDALDDDGAGEDDGNAVRVVLCTLCRVWSWRMPATLCAATPLHTHTHTTTTTHTTV